MEGDGVSIGKLGKYLKPYRVQCVLGPFFKLVEAVLELYLPLLMAQVIDKGGLDRATAGMSCGWAA